MITERVIERLQASFSKLEVELRQNRLYDNLDMEPSKFWDIFNAYKAEVNVHVQNQLQHPTRSSETAADRLAFMIVKAADDEVQLRNLIKIGLYNRVMEKSFTRKQLDRQTALADCRYPMEWFPRARGLQRELHLHVGPTNS